MLVPGGEASLAQMCHAYEEQGFRRWRDGHVWWLPLDAERLTTLDGMGLRRCGQLMHLLSDGARDAHRFTPSFAHVTGLSTRFSPLSLDAQDGLVPDRQLS